jgi:hypothetical protein
MAAKSVRITLDVPAGLHARICQAADLRCITPELFLVTMAAWHAPVQDREVEQLRTRVQELEAEIRAAAERAPLGTP